MNGPKDHEKEGWWPAFPVPENVGTTHVPDGRGDTRKVMLFGMSLRDYLAAKCMAALIGGRTVAANSVVPSMSYEMADLMLAERQKGQKP